MDAALTHKRPGATLAVCTVLAGALGSTAVAAATLSVRLLQTSGEPLVGAVVTVRSRGDALSRREPVAAVVRQVKRAFVPDLLVVPVGSTVSFPNNDDVSHQVYSFAKPKRFQLPLYRGRPYPPVKFDTEGLVTVGCNIHDEMVGYILITAAHDFGITGSAGEWGASALAAGDYEIAVWHPRLREPAPSLTRHVQLGATDRGELSIRLMRPLQPAHLASHMQDDY
ncbi:MAG: hypothetical protein WCE48_03680 [Steroidobacteraceae bacterium]